MKEKIKKILNFIKRSFPDPLLRLLVLSLLVSIFISVNNTYREKSTIDQRILEKEKVLQEEQGKREIEYSKELKECGEKKEECEKKPFSKECVLCGVRKSFRPSMSSILWDEKLQQLKRIKEESAIYLWLENLLSSPFFFIPILLIVIFPLIRVVIIFIKSLKFLILRVKEQITKMTGFQKYLLILVFCIFVALLLITIIIF